jgi:hypothetical protein
MRKFFVALWAYAAHVGVQTDVYINQWIPGAVAGMTISKRCAIAAGWRQDPVSGLPIRDQPRHPIGCFMCWFLGWDVQRHHCADQFCDAPTPWYDCLRAVLAFAAAGAMLTAFIHFALWLL